MEITNKILVAINSNGMISWHVAAQEDNLEALEEVWDWAKEKPTTAEINNKLLLTTDEMGRTVCHVALERGNLK
jgi:hypothetical protein